MPIDQKLLQGQFPEIERCACGMLMQAVDQREAAAAPLAYKWEGAKIVHVVGSLPCNQRQELKRAEALGLTQVPYTKGWHETMRAAYACDKSMEFVAVVDLVAKRGDPPYSLFVPYRASLFMQAHPSPAVGADTVQVFEAAAKVIAVCTGTDVSEAVVTLKASLTMQMWERDEPLTVDQRVPLSQRLPNEKIESGVNYKGKAQFLTPQFDPPQDWVDASMYATATGRWQR